jgi:PAS domain S-box-containing protein
MPSLDDAFLAHVLDNVPQPVLVMDEARSTYFCNRTALSVTGYDDLDELRGRPSHQVLHYKRLDGSFYPESECPIAQARDTGIGGHGEDEWFVRRDGSMFPAAWWVAPLKMTSGYGSIMAFTDLTERKAGERARLELTAAKLARWRIVESTVRARRQIARDIHDGPQQSLASLHMELRQIHRQITSDAGNIDARLERAMDSAEAAIEELRGVAAGIHPSILTTRGLLPTIAVLARRTALPVTIRGTLPIRLPETVEVSAYYFVSEALTNTIKHAHASSATVTVGIHGSCLRLEVQDDGVGGARLSEGGLAGLADRVEALDGHLIIESPPGAGTTLNAEIPLSPFKV